MHKLPNRNSNLKWFAFAIAAMLAISNVVGGETLEIAGKKVDLGKVDIKTASLDRKMTGHLIEFTVQNLTSTALGDLVLEYKIFVRSSFPGARPNAPVTRVISDKIPVELLAPRQKIELGSRPFTMNSRRLNSGWVYSNAAAPRSRDTFLGYAAIMKNRDGKMIAQTATSPEFLENWEEEPQAVPFPYLAERGSGDLPLTVEPGGLGGGASSSSDDSNEDEQE